MHSFAGEPYCYLTTTGRVSGQPREIEIWFGLSGETLFMLSGGRDRSNWVRNLARQPKVTVRIASQVFNGEARIVDEGTDEDALARRLLLEKYQPTSSSDLAEWGRTALPVAVKLTLA